MKYFVQTQQWGMKSQGREKDEKREVEEEWRGEVERRSGGE